MRQSKEPEASATEAEPATSTRTRKATDARRAAQQEIDENLRRVYQEALEQELPDRFSQLLQQLRQKESGR